MGNFTRARRERKEPPGLDAFAAATAQTPIIHVVREAAPDEGDAGAEETVGMNIRFTREQKRALELLAKREDRSQQKIVARLLGPLLLERAAALSSPE